MRKAIVATHGRIAEEFIETLKMFVSEMDFTSICFLSGMSIDLFGEEVEKILLDGDPEEIIIFVDIFGGSPCNKVLETIKKNQAYFSEREYSIISGVNLPMLLEYSFTNDKADFQSMLGVVVEKSAESIKTFPVIKKKRGGKE